MLTSTKERLVEFDLVWLYNHASADCGIKSNYMSMINVACYGASTTFHDPYNSFILKSVEHKRKLEAIIDALSRHDQYILYSVFADIHYSRNIELIYNKCTGPAMLNSFINQEKLEKICRQFHLGIATDKDKILISQIRVEATANYYAALDRYLIEKKRQFKRYPGDSK